MLTSRFLNQHETENQVSLNIVLNYTERALAVIGGRPSEHFSYAPGAPFPQAGDLVENQTASGPRRFIVLERVFTFRADSLSVQLLLDLAS